MVRPRRPARPPSAPWTPPWPRWLNLSLLGWIDPWVRLLTRLVVGTFLLWGVWGMVTLPSAMAALTEGLASRDAPWPGLAAPIAVYAQMACGLAFIAGLLTRWAGLVCAVMFSITASTIYPLGGLEGALPAILLVLIGLDLLARGPGPLNLRALLVGR